VLHGQVAEVAVVVTESPSGGAKGDVAFGVAALRRDKLPGDGAADLVLADFQVG